MSEIAYLESIADEAPASLKECVRADYRAEQVFGRVNELSKRITANLFQAMRADATTTYARWFERAAQIERKAEAERSEAEQDILVHFHEHAADEFEAACRAEIATEAEGNEKLVPKFVKNRNTLLNFMRHDTEGLILRQNSGGDYLINGKSAMEKYCKDADVEAERQKAAERLRMRAETGDHIQEVSKSESSDTKVTMQDAGTSANDEGEEEQTTPTETSELQDLVGMLDEDAATAITSMVQDYLEVSTRGDDEHVAALTSLRTQVLKFHHSVTKHLNATIANLKKAANG